jgi:hypothetical protein
MRTPARAARLALLVEPGPGQGGLPFTLVVRHLHNRDAVIARAPVQGLTYLEFDVPVPPGAITTLCFSSENPGLPTGADARVLNFRVFACGAGAARRATPASKAAETSGWPALTIASRPVTKDWRFEMEPQRRQLADMGNPPFLHTNACRDFMLMAREHWFDLRGFGEVDTFSMHLDSLLCYSAHYSGAAEQVLRDPLRVYRLERSAEAGRTPEAGSKLEAAASDDLVWLVGRMRSLQVPVIFNLTDWGLGDYHLAETSPAASATAPTSEAAR